MRMVFCNFIIFETPDPSLFAAPGLSGSSGESLPLIKAPGFLGLGATVYRQVALPFPAGLHSSFCRSLSISIYCISASTAVTHIYIYKRPAACALFAGSMKMSLQRFAAHPRSVASDFGNPSLCILQWCGDHLNFLHTPLTPGAQICDV